MAKVRIHVLAKELDIQSKDILSFLAEKNINDKTASSSIEDETIAMVRNRFQKSKAGGKPESAAGQRPEGKPEPKAGGKAEPESKPEPKAGEKAGSEQKSEVKAAGKTEPESKPEPKAGEKAGSEPRPEPKAVGKPEQEPKTVGKTEPEAKPEPKAAGKPEDRTKVKTEQRQEGKAELSRTEQTEPKIEGKAGTKTEERPKKKSSITAVFNPQNSKMGGRKSQGRGSRDRGARADGRRQAGASQGKRPAPQEQPQRTASERAEAVKAKFDKILGIERPAPAPKPERRPEQAAQEKAARIEAFTTGEKLVHGELTGTAEKVARGDAAGTAERTARGDAAGNAEKAARGDALGAMERPSRSDGASGQERGARGENGSGQERGARSERSSGQERTPRENGSGQERGARSERSSGQERGARGERSSGQERGARGERPSGQERSGRGERPGQAGGQNRAGDRNRPGQSGGQNRPMDRNRPAGQGRGGSERGPRNESEKAGSRSFQNGRPGGNRPQGDKNGARIGGNRPGESRNRFEQEINKMKQEAPVVTEELRKESRDRRSGQSQKQSKTKEKGVGPKKQERLVNLEKNAGKHKKPQAPAPVQKEEEVIRTIILPEKLTIKELAEKMKVQASAIVKKLFMQGIMVTVNQEIDFEKAEEIALEFNCICEMEEKVDVIEELLKEDEEDVSKMVKRPPVVCVMGHVDHGKTSLLDAIRNTHVIDREAGGITQHIGAYMVTCNGEKITFLDTPGHEAFTAMRMRGANATDIAILVVAADDGVMPQTVEAISHAKAAGVEIIVAINKIDKPSANIERVKQELSEYDLIPEDWGGSTVFCPVSAHTHEGLDNLLEMILLTAEVMELKANPKRQARGLVIEAQLDKGRGAVATVLVQKGTLKVGQPIAAGSCSGKVRAMIDDKGRRVKEAGPSTPVEILGLNSVPNAGDVFVSTDTEKEAKHFADTFISQGREKLLEDTKAKMSLDDLFSQIQSGNVKELNIIVKADVQGSVEAVKQSLVKLSNEEVVVKIIHGGVGAINESDVSLASASNAIIIGFNVRPDAQAKASAEREGVDLRLYKVIYNAIEDVQAAMKGMLDPIFEEKILGHAEVRQIFKASGVGNIAGSYVLDGVFQRGCKVRLLREGKQLFEGNLASLKRFKDDVKEVRAGYECGLVLDGFNDIEELDVVEAYTMVEVPR